MSFLTDARCPVFNAERIMKVPDFNDYRVEIGGCEKEGSYPLPKFLEPFEHKTVNSRLTSVSGWSIRADWAGVPWADFVAWAKPKADHTHVYFESWGKYVTVIEKKHMDNPRIVIATHVGDDEIEFDYGGPIRMIVPNLWGYKSCKWLKRIHFIDEYIIGFWEGAGYPHEGLIEPGFTIDINSGERKPLDGGEVLDW